MYGKIRDFYYSAICRINDHITPSKVKITQKMTNQIIPSKINEKIQHIYNYMNKLLAFPQIKLLYKNIHVSVCIINYDFHCKISNELLYCIIIKDSNICNSKYEWIMKDELFTNIETLKLLNKYNIKYNSLPKSIGMDKYFTCQNK